MSGFLDFLIARSFSSEPAAIRPRPVARFELPDIRPVEEETLSKSPVAPATRGREHRGTEWHRAATELERAPDLETPQSDLPPGPELDPIARLTATPPVDTTNAETLLVERQVRHEHTVERPIAAEIERERRAARAAAVPDRSVVARAVEIRRVEKHIEHLADTSGPVQEEGAHDVPPGVQVEISIGRIELGSPRHATPPRAQATPLKPAVTLDQYLRRRTGGRQ